jgi:hypothetical protein
MLLSAILCSSIFCMRNKNIFLIVILSLITVCGYGQKNKSVKQKKTPAKSTTQNHKNTPVKKTQVKNPEPEKIKTSEVPDENKVRDIVSFLEYMLNTIGSAETPSRDKDVMITESYTKIFRDSKVQIEDDLDENRNVITYKDVMAYLKDVDFFYTQVKFEFTVNDITSGSLTGGNRFYKVSLSRNLKGTTTSGKPVNNTTPRFVEINYNEQEQDLKIVSIYTNEFNEKESLLNWWSDLSYEWKAIFKNKLELEDSVSLDDIRSVTSITALNLGSNKYIQTLQPLTQLLNLDSLNLSNTNINDLTPLRNLSELKYLDISNDPVRDLEPLKYANNLQALIMNGSSVSDLSVLGKMTNLKQLELRHTPGNNFDELSNVSSLRILNLEHSKIADLTPLQNLSELRELNLSRTPIQKLDQIVSLKKIRVLNIDSTQINNFKPIASIDSLQTLYASNTALATLAPFQNLKQIAKIFCDQTNITATEATEFSQSHAQALIIYDTKDLNSWWNDLPLAWQNILRKKININEAPTKEDLARITLIDSIDVGGNATVKNILPLQRLQKLSKVILNQTGIHDLSPLKNLTMINYLDISETEVSDLSPLSNLRNLQVLMANKTKVENLEPLYDLHNLKIMYADHTYIHNIIARDFLERNSNCLIIYKTIHLNRWWKNMEPEWKKAFQQQLPDTTSSSKNLHALVEQRNLKIQDVPVKNLTALSEFVRLLELNLSGTAISDISFLTNIPTLRSLHIINSPLQKTEALKSLTDLEDLDISNTPVDDLKDIESLKNIKSLNCSGTQIKKLAAIKSFSSLEVLDFSNTNVNNLDVILHLPLKTLKCYNTKLSSREIDMFRKHHPDCNIVFYR